VDQSTTGNRMMSVLGPAFGVGAFGQSGMDLMRARLLTGGNLGVATQGMNAPLPGGGTYNNPLNIMPDGVEKAYPTLQAGFQDTQRLLWKGYNNMSLAGIVKKWANPSASLYPTYLKNVAQWSGINNVNAPLNLRGNQDLTNRLMAAMGRQESGTQYTPQQVSSILAGGAPAGLDVTNQQNLTYGANADAMTLAVSSFSSIVGVGFQSAVGDFSTAVNRFVAGVGVLNQYTKRGVERGNRTLLSK